MEPGGIGNDQRQLRHGQSRGSLVIVDADAAIAALTAELTPYIDAAAKPAG